MIRHIVLIKFNPELKEAEIKDIWQELHKLKGKVQGLISISSGKSMSPEKIERGYLHGFTIDFENRAALEAYQNHPDHKKLSERLIANATNGLEGILVFDLPPA